MRVPVPWLREYVDLPAELSTAELADHLTAFDLKLEEIVTSGITGPLVVGRVLELVKEPQKNGKTINWCRVDVGAEHNDASVPDAPGADVPSRGIICGAHNFVVGDLVVVSLPGTFLPVMGFEIGSRKTYGHVSDGMICSTAELGIPGDAEGIIVLEPGSAEPGDSAVTVLGLGDEVLDLEVNPDRAYALSMRGVARDASIALGVPFTDPADVVLETSGQAHPVTVEDPLAAPVFTTRLVTGFDATRPTPDWMARRLEQAGMRSISLAVDVSNYVMLELGQPNHAYDRAKLHGALGVRRAHAGEKLTTLDDVERVLDVEDLLIVDESGPVGLAGVMGAAHVEIDESTTDVVIEAACFDPVVVFRSARRHKLGSEAAKRFERGVDTALQARAATRVGQLLVELGGGVLEPGLTQVGTAPQRAPIELDVDLPARIIGLDIAADQVVSALQANGCSVEVRGERIAVQAPSWRPDLTDPFDVVEEVLRVVGYDQVPSVLPTPTGGRGLTAAQKLRRRIGLVLAGEGLVEVKTFPFAGPEDFDRLGLAADDSRRRQVLLENPLSAEQPGMTTTLLTGLLRALQLNLGRGHADVHLTETGRVFHPTSAEVDAPIYGVQSRPSADEVAALDAALPDQPQHVAWVLSGERVRSGWAGPGRPVTWADAVQVAQRVAASVNVALSVEQAEHLPWHPGRCAALLVDGTVIGHAGELHPQVLTAHGLPPRVVAAELDLDALVSAAPALGPKPSFSTQPVAKEDLAFVAPDAVTAEALRLAVAGADPAIESVRLFDVYTGDQVPEGHRSLAFALRLRGADHTLGDDEIKAVRGAAVAAATALGATLR